MEDKYIAYIFLLIGAVMLSYTILGRLLRFNKDWRWSTGGKVSLSGELGMGLFMICMSLITLRGSAIWLLPAIVGWGVAFLCQRMTRNKECRRRNKKHELAKNANPKAFSDSPLINLDECEESYFEVYDIDESVYIGIMTKQELSKVIDNFSGFEKNDTNDIFLLYEAIDLLKGSSMRRDTIQLLKKYSAEEGSITLRWVPKPE
jgi:hypothetical protein